MAKKWLYYAAKNSYPSANIFIKDKLVAYHLKYKSRHSFCGRFVPPFFLTPFLKGRLYFNYMFLLRYGSQNLFTKTCNVA
jgi:hypothetical protein